MLKVKLQTFLEMVNQGVLIFLVLTKPVKERQLHKLWAPRTLWESEECSKQCLRVVLECLETPVYFGVCRCLVLSLSALMGVRHLNRKHRKKLRNCPISRYARWLGNSSIFQKFLHFLEILAFRRRSMKIHVCNQEQSSVTKIQSCYIGLQGS